MRRKTFSIMFFIKRTKLLRNDEAPIFMRITIDGERAEASVKRSINPDQWNDARGCAWPNTIQAKELNYYLEHIRHKVYLHQQEMEDRNKAVTAITLKNAFLGVDDEENRTILQLYREHNERLKLLINNGVASGTYQRHVTSRKHLGDFIKRQYSMSDYCLKDIDHEFITEYETYLRTIRNCCNNTAVKYIKNLGKIIRMALDNEWIRSNPFRNIRYRLEEVDKPFLNQEELTAVIHKNFPVQRIAQVRDVFVFCCFTGLAFVDVKSLSPRDIETGVDGNLWIRKQRHKTRQWANIPLLPVAKTILEKYRTHPECIRKGILLPVYTNQKMNAYLKEVVDLCGISKNLTTHCARHTFATTVTLANHVSMESVSKMLGHASINMTKKYARILDSTIGKEMSTLLFSALFCNTL